MLDYVLTPDGEIIFRVLSIDEIIKFLKIFPSTNKCLIHDIAYIERAYSKTNDLIQLSCETSSGETIKMPYTIEYDYRNQSSTNHDLGHASISNKFCFPSELAQHRKDAIEHFKTKKALKKGNLLCPRVFDFDVDTGLLALDIQKAEYFDQVGTNLSLDAPLKNPLTENGIKCSTPREWDIAQATGKVMQLPPLNKSKLANTIGIAVGITAIGPRGQKFFLERKRSRKVAVYADQWHLPFSFSLAWNPGLQCGKKISISDLISQDWGHEFSEELGLEQSYFEKPIPVAFCRDLIRGGKPQFFFELPMKLGAEDFINKVKPDSHHEYVGRSRGLSSLRSRRSSELNAFLLLMAGRT